MPEDERDKYCKEVCLIAYATHIVLEEVLQQLTLQVLYWQAWQSVGGSTQHAFVYTALASTCSAHHMTWSHMT